MGPLANTQLAPITNWQRAVWRHNPDSNQPLRTLHGELVYIRPPSLNPVYMKDNVKMRIVQRLVNMERPKCIRRERRDYDEVDSVADDSAADDSVDWG